MTPRRSSHAKRLSLAYSAPIADPNAPELTAVSFYNAFPELNDADLDQDGLPLVFPERAKYLISLDGWIIPQAMFVGRDDLDDELLASLHPDDVEQLLAAIADDPTARMMIPRAPALRKSFVLYNDFELAHQRLTATAAKWRFRAFTLAQFYAELERALLQRKRSVSVPLEPDASSDAPALERSWRDVYAWLRTTIVLDEAASLLIVVILDDEEDVLERRRREQRWRRQETRELRGYTWRDPQSDHEYDFNQLYMQLRDRFPREAHEDDREALAEAVIEYVQSLLDSDPAAPTPELPDAAGTSTRGPVIRWPRLVEIDKAIELRVDPGFLGGARPHKSIAALAQQLLAIDAVVQHRGASFHDRGSTWPHYNSFDVEFEGDEAFVVPRFTAYMIEAIERGFRDRAGVPVDRETSIWIARYVIFIESMAQQFCSGVGLRCPYGDDPECCGAFRALLRRAHDITRPHPYVANRWELPPCLA